MKKSASTKPSSSRPMEKPRKATRDDQGAMEKERAKDMPTVTAEDVVRVVAA